MENAIPKARKHMPNDRLILWRWTEAEECNGDPGPFISVSSQLRTADVGDRLFVCGTQNDELYLLGVLKVTDVRPEPDRHAREAFGDYRAKCTNVCAPFRIIPLGGVKWN